MSKVSVMVVMVMISVVTPEAVPHPHWGWGRGLAFAGGYALGHHRGHYHHHHGYGCGYCYGRRKRSLDNMMDQEVLEDLYWKIATMDKDECGLRLVCELSQKDVNSLTGDELQILYPYFGGEESGETYFGRYDKAVWHGHQGAVCHELYSRCVFPAPQIMAHFNNFTMADFITAEQS